MSWLSRLTERRILKARAEGQLQGLEGEGQPLPDRPVESDAAEAVGYRVMAQAGVLPEEITLQKQVDAQRAHLAGLTDPAERKAAMARLAELEMRKAIATESRRRFMKG